MRIELVASLAGIGGGKGGYWEDSAGTSGMPAFSHSLATVPSAAIFASRRRS